MPPLLIAAIIAAGAAATYQVGHGLHQTYGKDNKYNRMVRDLAKYQVDPNIKYNRDLAATMANEGLPSSAKNFYGDQIDRGLSSTISAIHGGGGNLGQINQSFGQSTDAFRNLMAMDAQQKQQNQLLLMNANKDLASENMKAWNYNVNIPQQLILGHFEKRRNQGPQNIVGGLTGISNAFAMGAGASNGGGGNKMGSDTGTTQPFSSSQNNTQQYFNQMGSGYGLDYQQPMNSNQNGMSQQDIASFIQMIQQMYGNQNVG